MSVSNDVKQSQFASWLLEMDNTIAKFVQSSPPEIRKKLDGSDESLGIVEQWILSRFDSPKEASATEAAYFVDGAARYIGEILRKNTKSKWIIELENPKDVFFGIPTLRGGMLKAPLCPLTTVTASTDRRTGMYFDTILRNIQYLESRKQ